MKNLIKIYKIPHPQTAPQKRKWLAEYSSSNFGITVCCLLKNIYGCCISLQGTRLREFFIMLLRTQARAGKRDIASQRRGSLLQSLSSDKTVHRTVLSFTSCGAPAVWGFRRLRTATMGFRPLTLMTLGSCEATVKKRSIENFSFLDKT